MTKKNLLSTNTPLQGYYIPRSAASHHRHFLPLDLTLEPIGLLFRVSHTHFHVLHTYTPRVRARYFKDSQGEKEILTSICRLVRAHALITRIINGARSFLGLRPFSFSRLYIRIYTYIYTHVCARSLNPLRARACTLFASIIFSLSLSRSRTLHPFTRRV